MNWMRSSTMNLVAIFACAIGFAVANLAHAQPIIGMSGSVSYSHSGYTATMSVQQIDNVSTDQGISSTLRLELWAFPAPYGPLSQAGYRQSGHLLATYNLGPLALDYHFSNIYSGDVPFTPPPPGTWYITMLLTEYGSGLQNAYGLLPVDYVNFPAEYFPPTPPRQNLATITPVIGSWWNPAEPGTGYNIDYLNGMLVVTVYSFQTEGAPQWYLASGLLIGTTFTGTLDKYVGGQCISCVYTGRPALVGNDGTITINFTTPSTATVSLPGGRTTVIQRMVF